MQGQGFDDNGVVYVNLDSYWDKLSDQQLASFVSTCHANGQKAGIYRAPFADWAGVATRVVEGPGSRYTSSDSSGLRDAANKPIKLDGAWALDPTHPGTMAQVDNYLDEFKAVGFAFPGLASIQPPRTPPRRTGGLAGIRNDSGWYRRRDSNPQALSDSGF